MSLPFVGQVIASKYELARMIARGGMGSVWEAKHVSLGTPVAVKFMEPTMAESADLRGRFEREAKAAARLQSPHVVQVQDHGVDGAVPYIVMELLHGEDLRARLRRGRLGLSEASRLATHAGRALRAAHAAGIVHRDLKPANVFLVQADDDEVTAKLLDFGIAKGGAPAGIDPAESTATGQLLGSPEYMSPEQARSARQVDARTDLWSLGVILYLGITGHKPFAGEGVGDLFVKICTERHKPPSFHDPSFSPELDAFFEKALAKDPDARFQSARDMAAAFAQIATTTADGSSRASLPDGSEGRPLTGVSANTSIPTMLPILPGKAAVESGAISGETLSASSAPHHAISQSRRSPTWARWIAIPVIAVVSMVSVYLLTTRSTGSNTVGSPSKPATTAAPTGPRADAAPPAPTVAKVEVTPSEAPSASAAASAASSRPGGVVRPSLGKGKIKPNFGY